MEGSILRLWHIDESYKAMPNIEYKQWKGKDNLLQVMLAFVLELIYRSLYPICYQDYGGMVLFQ